MAVGFAVGPITRSLTIADRYRASAGPVPAAVLASEGLPSGPDSAVARTALGGPGSCRYGAKDCWYRVGSVAVTPGRIKSDMIHVTALHILFLQRTGDTEKYFSTKQSKSVCCVFVCDLNGMTCSELLQGRQNRAASS